MQTLPPGVASSKTACWQPAHSAETGGNHSIPQGPWPWQINILINGSHSCGGSLIDQQWVLSAAHCFPADRPTNQYEVVLGAYQPSNTASYISTFSVEKIIRHPSYNGGIAYSRDIAVVKLTSPVNFTNYIAPICLPESSVQFSANIECWVTIWEDTQYEEPSEAPQTIPELEVPPINQSSLHKPFNVHPVEIWSKEPIKQDIICAVCQKSGRDSCQGNVGGDPMVCRLKESWIQAGILSWGRGCTESSHSEFYVSVPFYTKWIQEKIYDKNKSYRGSGGLWNTSNKIFLCLTLMLLAIL